MLLWNIEGVHYFQYNTRTVFYFDVSSNTEGTEQARRTLRISALSAFAALLSVSAGKEPSKNRLTAK
jgi:hypothetical protein